MTSARPVSLDQADYWRQVDLPDTWPDDQHLSLFHRLCKIFRQLLSGTVKRVQLPDNLPEIDKLPKYLLQEFHSLPNGNFSKNIAAGYAHSFDKVMLGVVKKERARVAKQFAGHQTALDIGTGGGHMARALKDAGVNEVWGLEPSPYLLQLAAKEHHDLKLLHGVVEAIPLPDTYVDVVTACFVFHEIPPRYADEALKEIHRVLKPGGTLVFIEPSPTQMAYSRWKLFRKYGMKGLYFHAVASHVFEPFIKAWHKRQIDQWLPDFGFQILEDVDALPLRTVTARRMD